MAVVLRDLSEHGALIETKAQIDEGAEVLLCRNDLQVSGHVAWSRERLAGISFAKRLRPEVVLRHISRAPLRPIVEPLHRRPGFTQPGMSAEERRWFDEMNGGPQRPNGE